MSASTERELEQVANAAAYWRDRGCTCEFAMRPLGRLHGVNMGRGPVRLRTAQDCPTHNEHRFEPDSEGWCVRCRGKRLTYWAHPEVRREMFQ